MPGPRNWRDLRLRILSAAVLAPLGLLCIWLGGAAFILLVLAAMVGLGVEWAGLLRQPLRQLRGIVLLAWPAIACIAAIVTNRWDEALLMLLVPAVLGLWLDTGIIAIGLGGIGLLWLRFMTGSGWDGVLFVILVVWASDTFAYVAGRAIGGAKLAPRISPGKTWSGSIGGLAGAMLVGGVLALLMPVPPGIGIAQVLLRGVGFGLLLGLASQSGDLAESAFKRRCGVKDSGRLIPGHGGLLDRLDGVLAAVPVAALLSLAAPFGLGFWYAGAPLSQSPVGRLPLGLVHAGPRADALPAHPAWPSAPVRVAYPAALRSGTLPT